MRRVYGFEGDDLIRTDEGNYKVWGGDGSDQAVDTSGVGCDAV